MERLAFSACLLIRHPWYDRAGRLELYARAVDEQDRARLVHVRSVLLSEPVRAWLVERTARHARMIVECQYHTTRSAWVPTRTRMDMREPDDVSVVMRALETMSHARQPT